jgi:hypothetical protein
MVFQSKVVQYILKVTHLSVYKKGFSRITMLGDAVEQYMVRDIA